ncbi:O-methyltransferase [Vitiosangium sp. GDMCC 1.1324]|uniref:O-methyltransferase n=1 Tax=Vitiosangium sp. (strain GDMCC 1.1324) TaxID=2138576 RepID=UPI000D3C6A92|nr:class I SAM-dependent methyltransferase [Vitiosangium sp. GDMCC 1.1324]PTL85359.1 methyltransferase [Vitiosangium sp. GDMCC 1.1324]
MPNSLQSEPVAAVLDRLYAQAEKIDPEVLEPAMAEARRRKGPLDDRELAGMLRRAFMPVSRDVGHLLYMMVRTSRCRRVIEFGTSFGISTIFLAAALKDSGGGTLVTTELEPDKVRRAREHFAEAGLSDIVEVREGDARETLRDVEPDVDFVLLDGWKGLYLPVLQLLEPKLRTGSLIIADDIDLMPEVLTPYLQYVHRERSPYFAVKVPMGDGLDVAMWTR